MIRSWWVVVLEASIFHRTILRRIARYYCVDTNIRTGDVVVTNKMVRTVLGREFKIRREFMGEHIRELVRVGMRPLSSQRFVIPGELLK